LYGASNIAFNGIFDKILCIPSLCGLNIMMLVEYYKSIMV
jgi:hypothetical protein